MQITIIFCAPGRFDHIQGNVYTYTFVILVIIATEQRLREIKSCGSFSSGKMADYYVYFLMVLEAIIDHRQLLHCVMKGQKPIAILKWGSTRGS